MEFKDAINILSPDTRAIYAYKKTKEQYLEEVDEAVELVLRMSAKEIGAKAVPIFDRDYLGKCPACDGIVFASDNYCSKCGLKILWGEKE